MSKFDILLNEKLTKYSDRVMYKFKDEFITYNQMNNYINILQEAFHNNYIREKEKISFYLDNPLSSCIVALTILKMNGTCAPMKEDIEVQNLIDFLLKSEIYLLITNKNTFSLLPPELKKKGKIFYKLDKFDELYLIDLRYKVILEKNKYMSSYDEDIAYIFFTSGSTGKPKGAKISYKSLIVFMEKGVQYYNISCDDIMLCHVTFHSDMSLFTLFYSISVGARCILLTIHERGNPYYLKNLINKEKVTILHLIPSTLFLLIQSQGKYEHVRLIATSGEQLTLSLVKKVRKLFGEVEIYNIYGNTETNDALSYKIPLNIEELKEIPIGKPYDYVIPLIMDQDTNSFIEEGIGELVLYSETMMTGYLHEDASKTFLQPNNSQIDKFYPTGDIVKKINDTFYYLGRKDDRVKINGNRVYLNQIKEVLSLHEHIEEVEILTKEISGINKIVAVIKAKKRISLLTIKKYCSEHLPSYAIPSYLEIVDRFPKTSSGKVDRQKIRREIINKLR